MLTASAALLLLPTGVDPKEVYAAMLIRERQRIPIDQTNSYLQYRTIIVDWMCEVAEEFKLNPYAVQLSVHYFDLALQRVKVKKSQLQLVAMCCTLLAGVLLSDSPLNGYMHEESTLCAAVPNLTNRAPVACSQVLRTGGTRATDRRLECMLQKHVRPREDREDGGRYSRRAAVGHG
eukprot:COSAG02_NODE_7410_length_3027_cov_30.403689_2_plen_177_part_00